MLTKYVSPYFSVWSTRIAFQLEGHVCRPAPGPHLTLSLSTWPGQVEAVTWWRSACLAKLSGTRPAGSATIVTCCGDTCALIRFEGGKVKGGKVGEKEVT